MSPTAPFSVSYTAQRKGQGLLSLVPLLAGLFMVLFAAGAWPERAELVTPVAGGGAAFLAFAGLLWLHLSDPALPSSGLFDDASKRFVLVTADGTRSEIPYSEFTGFRVRRRVSNGRSKSVSFIVYLLKRDGGFWDLESHKEESSALDSLERIKSWVGLQAGEPETAFSSAILPPAVSCEVQDAATIFTWKNQARAAYSLCMALAGAGLCAGLMGAIASAIENAGLAAFVWLVLGVLVVIITWRTFTGHGKSFRLEVGPRFLTYSTRRRFASTFSVEKVLPLESVTCLQVTFEIAVGLQQRTHKLTFLHEDQSERLQNLRFGELTGPEATALLPTILELDLPGIRTSDVLKFEACLQRELDRLGHHVS